MASLDALKFANEANPPTTSLGLRVVERVGGEIANGVTGELFTSPAIAEGQVIRIVLLTTTGAVVQGGISLVADGNALFSEQDLADASPDFGHWGVALTTTTTRMQTLFDEVYCKSFTINKNAGNTTEIIRYAYDVMEQIV